MVNIESIIYNIKLPPGFSLKKAVYCDTDRCYIQIKQRGECNRAVEALMVACKTLDVRG